MCLSVLSGNTLPSSGRDLSDFVESSEYLSKKYQADMCALINMHDLNSSQLSIFDEQLNLLVECVRKVLWTRVVIFLDGSCLFFG